MDIITLLGIMWRRWAVVVPVLVLTAVAGVVLLSGAEVRYSADGTVLLMVNRQTTQDVGANDAISASLGGVLLASALGRPAVEAELRDAGLESGYEAVADPDTGVVTLVVSGPEADDVLATVRALLDRAPTTLETAVGSQAAASLRVTTLVDPVIEDVTFESATYRLEVPLAVLATGEIGNPFPPGSSTMVTLTELSRRVEVAQAVLSDAPSAEYGVSGSTRAAAPIMTIVVEADVPEEVVRAYEIVLVQLSGLLEELQTNAGVPKPDQTVLVPLVPPAAVEQTSASVVRPAAAIALFGLGTACAAAIIVDLVVRRRQMRSRDLNRDADPDRDSNSDSDPDPMKRSEAGEEE